MKKRVIVTGTSGLAEGIKQVLANNYEVKTVSRRSGYDIDSVTSWAADFQEYDILVNCAYSNWSQVSVLECFCQLWEGTSKTIVNIGSMITDYSRSEQHLDHEYFPYRLHKQALQSAFSKLVKTSSCDLKLFNPGMIDTPMVQHIDGNKLSVDKAALYVKTLIEHKEIKRIDLWE